MMATPRTVRLANEVRRLWKDMLKAYGIDEHAHAVCIDYHDPHWQAYNDKMLELQRALKEEQHDGKYVCISR